MKRFFAIIFLLVFSNYCIASSEAATHLRKMLLKYRSLTVYEDNGKLVNEYTKKNNKKRLSVVKFNTVYIENESLLFNWEKVLSDIYKKLKPPLKAAKYTIKKDKSVVKVKFRSNKFELVSNLNAALSRATGISSGLSWMVPRYLSPELGVSPRFGASELTLMEINDKFIKIELNYNYGRTRVVTMYIDRKSYLLKKYEKRSQLKNGTKTYRVITYNVIKYK